MPWSFQGETINSNGSPNYAHLLSVLNTYATLMICFLLPERGGPDL